MALGHSYRRKPSELGQREIGEIGSLLTSCKHSSGRSIKRSSIYLQICLAFRRKGCKVDLQVMSRALKDENTTEGADCEFSARPPG